MFSISSLEKILMAKVKVDYKKAIAKIDYKRAIAAIATGIFAPVREVSDSVTVSDITLLSIGKGFADTMSLSDAGSIRMQNYCDFSYFDEDYVGTSATF
jgi:hypothetical protein